VKNNRHLAALCCLGLLAACARLTPPTAPAPTAAAAPAVPVFVPEPEPPPPSQQELLAQYVDRVQRLIRGNMLYKSKTGNPESLFEVALKPDMTIARVRLVKSSGNKRFDLAVKRAIVKTGSYPALPNGLEFSMFQTHKIKYRLHDAL